MDKYTDQVSANVAAVSANFHQSALYQEAYKSRGAEVGGFPGFWTLCAEAGVAFTDIMRLNYVSFNGEWLEAIDQFSDRVMHEVWSGETIPDYHMLASFAKNAITTHMDLED